MNTTCRLLGISLLAACTVSCGGGLFEKYYQGPDDVRMSNPYYDQSYAPPDDDHMPVYTTKDINADALKLEAEGYAPVGVSSFYAPESSSDVGIGSLQRFAWKLGAEAVLFQSRYKDTITGATPLILPTTSTSYTNASAQACGYYGCVNGTGTGTTTTYGSETVMVPYSTVRSDYVALYFIKVRSRLGLVVAPLSDAERQQLGTNKASKVTLVVRGSEAFNADVLPGDYLETINGAAVYDQKQLGQLLDQYEGQDAAVVLNRGGKTLRKNIHIDAVPKYVPPATTKGGAATAGTAAVAPASQATADRTALPSYTVVMVTDTGDEAKNLAVANKTCNSLGKTARKDQVRDDGIISYLCMDK